MGKKSRKQSASSRCRPDTAYNKTPPRTYERLSAGPPAPSLFPSKACGHQPQISEQISSYAADDINIETISEGGSHLPEYQPCNEDIAYHGCCSPANSPPPSPTTFRFRTPSSIFSIPSSSSPRSRKNSEVTSISIPASTGKTEADGAEAWRPHLPTLGKCPRHRQFYFTDDLVTLNVDDCLFRIHRCFLERESRYFRDLFERSSGLGNTDDAAIHVKTVRVSSFETLLRYLYHGIHDCSSYTLDDWISLLSVATDLSFQRLRERALEHLQHPSANLDAVERILLAEKYDISTWLAPAYVELCFRDGALRESEALVLGAKTTAQLAEVRERVLLDMIHDCQRQQPHTDKLGNWRLPKPSRDERRVEQLVNEVFWPQDINQ